MRAGNARRAFGRGRLMTNDKVDQVIWTVEALRALGRKGGGLALAAFVAWLFLRAIETTAQFAPLALLLAMALLGWALIRTRSVLITGLRGVPTDGTVLQFHDRQQATAGSRAKRLRQMEFTYGVDGQKFEGKTDWHARSFFGDLSQFQKVPLIMDASSPKRAYWVREVPGHIQESAFDEDTGN